ncbi:MAG: hypothetical protein B7733_03475 [Myxococcales bacterium FL481]|nr:MAG: hypothetical protein B7733_03475 [Myxococcales bacterium FL481]
MGQIAPFWLALALGVGCSTGCGRSPTPHDASTGPLAESPAEPSPAPVEGLHEVKCGCALSDVGQCGEFVEVAGEFLPLDLPNDDLGPMPFCGESDLQAQVRGEIREGRFLATSFELEPAKSDADK